MLHILTSQTYRQQSVSLYNRLKSLQMCVQSMNSLDRFLMCTRLVGLKISILDQDSIVLNNGKRLKNYNLKNCKNPMVLKVCWMYYDMYVSFVGFFSDQSKIVNVNKGCVTLWPCHLHLKSILRQKKNYGISNIYFTMQKT